jgi:hypothetical protein
VRTEESTNSKVVVPNATDPRRGGAFSPARMRASELFSGGGMGQANSRSYAQVGLYALLKSTVTRTEFPARESVSEGGSTST